MKIAQEAYIQWPAALRNRINWIAVGVKSHKYLMTALQQRRNFCLDRLSFLSAWLMKYKTEKAIKYGRINTFLPPLQLALLRAKLFNSSPSAFSINQQHYHQIFRHDVSGNLDVKEKSVRVNTQKIFVPFFVRLAPRMLDKQIQSHQHADQGRGLSINRSSCALDLESLSKNARPLQHEETSQIQAQAQYFQNLISHRKSTNLAVNAYSLILSENLDSYKEVSPESHSKPTNPFVKTHSLILATNPSPRKEASPEQLHQSNPRNTDVQFSAQSNKGLHFVHALSTRRISGDKEKLIHESNNLMGAQRNSEVASRAMRTESNAKNVLSQKNELKSIQLDRSEITQVADQVARVLEHRERFERERRGGFY